MHLEVRAQVPVADGPEEHRAVLEAYCFTCHATGVELGGLALDNLDLQTPVPNAEIWEEVLRKFRGRGESGLGGKPVHSKK